MNNELKPCPFCGGDVVAIVENEYGKHRLWSVYCEECDSNHGGLFSTEADAVDAWNSRPPEDALLARAEKAEAELAAANEDAHRLFSFFEIAVSFLRNLGWGRVPEYDMVMQEHRARCAKLEGGFVMDSPKEEE